MIRRRSQVILRGNETMKKVMLRSRVRSSISSMGRKRQLSSLSSSRRRIMMMLPATAVPRASFSSFSPATASAADASKKGKPWSLKDKIGLLLFGSLVGSTVSLGIWQSKRYFWKLDQVALRQRGLDQEPVPLPLSSSEGLLEEEGRGLEGEKGAESHRRYIVQGTYLHDKEIKVGPRSSPKSVHGPAGGMSVNPQGHYILTPLVVSDGQGKRIVLVNRGWAPLNAEIDRPQGIVTVVGVVSEGEKPGVFAPPNDLKTGKALWVDLPTINVWMNIPTSSPYMLQLAYTPPSSSSSSPTSSSSSPPPSLNLPPTKKYPVPRSSKDVEDFYVMPFTHLVYATTWFSLAGFGLVMTRKALGR